MAPAECSGGRAGLSSRIQLGVPLSAASQLKQLNRRLIGDIQIEVAVTITAAHLMCRLGDRFGTIEVLRSRCKGRKH
jgi:hypothetical protein